MRILSYLRDNVTILQFLAKKRDFIVDIMRQKIAAAFPEADPTNCRIRSGTKHDYHQQRFIFTLMATNYIMNYP